MDFLIINLRIVYVGQEIGISIGFSTISDVRDVLNGDDDVKKGFIKWGKKFDVKKLYVTIV